MFTLLVLLAIAPLNATADPPAGKLRAAIWYDLQVNALIGNGNWLASRWYDAGSETTPNLHIRKLRCDGGDTAQRCSFELIRDGGTAKIMGEDAPDKLDCNAIFTRAKDGWAVKHKHRRRAGHSQTTMQCKAIWA